MLNAPGEIIAVAVYVLLCHYVLLDLSEARLVESFRLQDYKLQ